MHVAADTVAGQLPHNAEMMGFRQFLNSVANITDTVAVKSGGRAFEEALLCHADQLCFLGSDFANSDGKSTVCLPAIQDEPAVY